MKPHKFINSDPAGFDSNCTVCGGKWRDAIHPKEEGENGAKVPPALSRYAHGGAGSTLLPLPEGRRREAALADGLQQLAARCGIKLREPLQIDSNGEFHLAVSNGTDCDGPKDPCGRWGEEFAALLNWSKGARCGYAPTQHHAPENGWCRLNHFAAQAMLEKAEGLTN